MARGIQLSDLISRKFLRELHHFLWTDPSVLADGVDAGWNCRDHALTTAFLIRSLGFNPVLFHGEAFFVKGPSGKSASVSYHQRPHSWIVIEKVGAVDLSIKPDLNSAGDQFHIPISCIFANRWIPRGKGSVFFAEDEHTYAQAGEALLRRRNHAAAIYFPKEAEHFHTGHLARAAGFAGSPLTQKLGAVYGNPSDLYAALMLHLHSLLEGNAQSLAALPFDNAWRKLAASREGAIERASLYMMEKVAAPEGKAVTAANWQTGHLSRAAQRR
jgi:hypothetical protein